MTDKSQTVKPVCICGQKTTYAYPGSKHDACWDGYFEYLNILDSLKLFDYDRWFEIGEV